MGTPEAPGLRHPTPPPSFACMQQPLFGPLPRREMRHIHALRRSAEAVKRADRGNPFVLCGVVPTADPSALQGVPSSGVGPPPLEPDEVWQADLPAATLCRPWCWWLSLLAHHASACRLPPGSCPVPCCGRARVLARQQLEQQPRGQESKGEVEDKGTPAPREQRAPWAEAVASFLGQCYKARLAAVERALSGGGSGAASAARVRESHGGGAREKEEEARALALAEAEAEALAEEEAAAAKAAAAAKLRLRRLFRAVAWTVVRLMRNSAAVQGKGPAKAASQGTGELSSLSSLPPPPTLAIFDAKPRAAYQSLRGELAAAVARLRGDGDGGVPVPVHGAIGLAPPGDLSFLAKQTPLAQLEADMHQLPRILGFDGLGPLADMPSRLRATASAAAVSTFDLERRFDSPGHGGGLGDGGDGGDGAALTDGDAAEVAQIKRELHLGEGACGAEVLSKLVLTHLRLTHGSSTQGGDQAGTRGTSQQSGGGQGAAGDGAAQKAPEVAQEAIEEEEEEEGGADSEEEWASEKAVHVRAGPAAGAAALKLKQAARVVQAAAAIGGKAAAAAAPPAPLAQGAEEGGMGAATAAASGAVTAEAPEDGGEGGGEGGGGATPALGLALALDYATGIAWVSNIPLLLTVRQPMGSDALELVGHSARGECGAYTAVLSEGQLEDLLPPLLKGDAFELGRAAAAASSTDGGGGGGWHEKKKKKAAVVKVLSPGADPGSLAFVGSRPSLARYLLTHAEALLRVLPSQLGSSAGAGHGGQLALALDPAGERARLAKLSQEARLSATSRASRRRFEDAEVALRVACRECHLERHRAGLAAARRGQRDGRAPHSSLAEARSMGAEDAGSSAARRYLAAPWSDVQEVEDMFASFDDDHSGHIDASEFQDLMYALGKELSDEGAAEGVAQIDLDRNGTVEFSEFALWWLVNEDALLSEKKAGGGGRAPAQGRAASAATRLRLKFAYEKRRLERKRQPSAEAEAKVEAPARFQKELEARRSKAARNASAARLEGDTAAFALETAMASRRGLTRAAGGGGAAGGSGPSAT